MKYSNIFLFACLIYLAAGRIRISADSLPKLNRRLADTTDKKITRSLVTRADKSKKVAKRKLLNGTTFGVITGLGGYGLGKLGLRNQEQQIKAMQQELRNQRIQLMTKERERDNAIDNISQQINESESNFQSYKHSLLEGIARFKTIIAGKLTLYSSQPSHNGLPIGSMKPLG